MPSDDDRTPGDGPRESTDEGVEPSAEGKAPEPPAGEDHAQPDESRDQSDAGEGLDTASLESLIDDELQSQAPDAAESHTEDTDSDQGSEPESEPSEPTGIETLSDSEQSIRSNERIGPDLDDEVTAATPEDDLLQTANEDALDDAGPDATLNDEAAPVNVVTDAQATEGSAAPDEDISSEVLAELAQRDGGSAESDADASVIEALGDEDGAEESEPHKRFPEKEAVTIVQDMEDDGEAARESPDRIEPASKPRPAAEAGRGEAVASARPATTGLRPVAAVAAGIFVFVAAFAFLYANRFREATDPSDLGARALDLGEAMELANELMGRGEHPEAIGLLEEALSATPSSPLALDAQYLMLEARFEGLPEQITAEQAAAFHEHVDRILSGSGRGHPRSAEALYWKGIVYEREGNPVAARTEYKEILENFGNAENVDLVLLSLGELELKVDRPEVAAQHLQRLMIEFPGSDLVGRAELLTGDAYAATLDTEAARVEYIKAAQKHIHDAVGAEAFERLAELSLRVGNVEDAIRDLKTRLEIATTVEGNDRVNLLLARAYRHVGEHEKARIALNELLDFYPESDVTPLAYVEMSRVVDELGMKDEALRIAMQSAEKYPEQPAVLRNAGDMLAAKGEHSNAAQMYVQAYDAGEESPELLLSAGRLYREAEELSAARDVLRRMETHHPVAPEALEGSIELARVLYEQGEVTDAVERLERNLVTTQTPARKLPVLSALGDIYGELGLQTKAAESYAEIARIASDPDQLARAATALLDASDFEDGLTVARRVAVPRLDPATAYPFLVAFGKVLLRQDPQQGLERIEQAYRDYPEQRSAEGNLLLLRANLTVDRNARARLLMADFEKEYRRGNLPWPQLQEAAVIWGDHLFDRRDFRAAADAYAIAIEPNPDVVAEIPGSQSGDAELRYWAAFQRGNALVESRRFRDSLSLFDQVAASSSRWADEAGAKAKAVRMELRLRGESTDAVGSD